MKEARLSRAKIPSAGGREVFLAGGLIVLAALAAYHNSFAVPFVFDDGPAILDNPTLLHLSRVLFPPLGAGPMSGRPVLNLSLALSHFFGGTTVWGYHA